MNDGFFNNFKQVEGKKAANINLERRLSLKKLCSCSTRQARDLVDYQLAVKLMVLPLGLFTVRGKQILSVAAGSREDFSLISALRFATGKELKIIEVESSLLAPAIFASYKGDDSLLSIASEELRKCNRNAEQPKHELPMADMANADSEPSKFLLSLIEYAVARQASDLHLIPRSEGSFVRLRVEGMLLDHTKAVCGLKLHHELISRLKVLSALDITCRNKPQDGFLKMQLPSGETPLRLSIMPTIYGERAVLRLSTLENIICFDELGLDLFSEQAMRKAIKRNSGMLVFSGPTGSGKSTTMYALMKELSEQNLNLVSIEDPVEKYLPNVSQTSISHAGAAGYSACLRSLLRQDPDVILLGEIRDLESAAAATNAALSGHLILTTVHAGSVFEAILRLAELGVKPASMAAAIGLISSQRLVPRLCPECRTLDLSATNEIFSAEKEAECFKPTGCGSCNFQGTNGLSLICETLLIDKSVSQILSSFQGKWDIELLKKSLCTDNYISLEESALCHLKAGDIDRNHFAGFKTDQLVLRS
jgi:type IV pilus assembly protein PilB